jgi:argininosuccinate lyase
VRKLHGEGRDFESLSLDEWRAASNLFDEDVVGRVSSRASAAAKTTPQSTAPAAVSARLAEVQGWLHGL